MNRRRDMRSRYFAYYIIILTLALSLLSGCARTEEVAKGILGISTKSLEDLRPQAIKETINADLNTCYSNSLEILNKSKMYIYRQDREKGVIAVYLSETDTTPVGIFFTKIDDRQTLIEITSRSLYAKESAATELLSELIISLTQ